MACLRPPAAICKTFLSRLEKFRAFSPPANEMRAGSAFVFERQDEAETLAGNPARRVRSNLIPWRAYEVSGSARASLRVLRF